VLAEIEKHTRLYLNSRLTIHSAVSPLQGIQMRLARLSLAAVTLISLVACSNDATGPVAPVRPAGPALSTGTMGSGMKSSADSLMTSTNTALSAVQGAMGPI
jgi:hypothetical protein